MSSSETPRAEQTPEGHPPVPPSLPGSSESSAQAIGDHELLSLQMTNQEKASVSDGVFSKIAEVSKQSLAPPPLPPSLMEKEAPHSTEAPVVSEPEKPAVSAPVSPVKASDPELAQVKSYDGAEASLLAETLEAIPKHLHLIPHDPEPHQAPRHSSPREKPMLKFSEVKAGGPTSASSVEPSMSLKVSGDMTIQLNFEAQGKSVLVELRQGRVQIHLPDGARFEYPLVTQDAPHQASA
ncbi:MAG: hypothetical protein ACO3A2_09795 [Bdellovibrionia bacterium]